MVLIISKYAHAYIHTGPRELPGSGVLTLRNGISGGFPFCTAAKFFIMNVLGQWEKCHKKGTKKKNHVPTLQWQQVPLYASYNMPDNLYMSFHKISTMPV